MSYLLAPGQMPHAFADQFYRFTSRAGADVLGNTQAHFLRIQGQEGYTTLAFVLPHMNFASAVAETLDVQETPADVHAQIQRFGRWLRAQAEVQFAAPQRHGAGRLRPIAVERQAPMDFDPTDLDPGFYQKQHAGYARAEQPEAPPVPDAWDPWDP